MKAGGYCAAVHSQTCWMNWGHVFDPFWTTKPNGGGVGLAICSAIIAAHHGTLTVANDPAGGAVFCFNLPVQAIE